MPRPNARYLFLEIFPSGEEADVAMVTAKIADQIPESVLRTVLEDGAPVAQFVDHYLVRNDGVYMVPDDDPSTPYPWLGRNLAKGPRWEKDGIAHTVLEVGARVDLGFMVAENCLVVEHDNSVVEYREIVYYAPGLGQLLAKDPGGQVHLRLKSVTALGEEQAVDLVRAQAPNAGQVRP